MAKLLWGLAFGPAAMAYLSKMRPSKRRAQISGDYRILYVVRDQEVMVIDIGDRKDVYR